MDFNIEYRATPLGLRPFLSYYGGKWRDAIKNYPMPRHNTIVEPFAGSAGYSVRYAHLNVVLCDKDPVIAAVWDYLIHVSSEEILALPFLEEGDLIESLDLPQEAKWLLGFWVNGGSAVPKNKPSK